jgi:ABC-type sugar transport system substrate-binding protein
MLTAHPEINLVWAANEGGTVGAVTAVVNKGKAGSVFVFGTDMSEQIGTFLLASDDVLQAVTGQKPFEIGQRALTAAIDALAKKPVEKKVALPGILFSRHQSNEVKKYMEFLASMSR